jgi:hypothetical protein
MGEASPIGSVLSTKPASSLELYDPVLGEFNKYTPREGHSPIQDILLDTAESGRSPGCHPHQLSAVRQPGREVHH